MRGRPPLIVQECWSEVKEGMGWLRVEGGSGGRMLDVVGQMLEGTGGCCCCCCWLAGCGVVCCVLEAGTPGGLQ